LLIFSPTFKKRGDNINKHTRINEEIRSREVRLIDSDGKQLGIVGIEQARETAEKRNLDLVEVSPNANPPVCKIMDFGKYRFEQSKKIKESKKKQKVVLTKEVRLRPKIEEHDYQTKLRQTINFISKGNKVKITLRFRGREMAHTELGKELLNKMIKDVNEVGVVEKKPQFQGRVITMVLAPKKKQ
jgi:translation initiation factor IF-3